jgi:hypothetical protein
MATNYDRAVRWMENALGHNDRVLGTGGYSATIFYEGDSIYSYGRHFEMARIMRDPKGDPSWVLVNGDTYSVTTSGHQGTVRGIVSTSGLPYMIVPYSALSAARIDRNSIEVIHTRPDRNWTEWVHCEPTGDYLTKPHPDGLTKKVTRRGWIGDRYTEGEFDDPVMVHDPDRRRLSANGHNIAHRQADGSWKYERYFHRLGDALFSAKVNGRRTRFLSSFDDQEARPLYFLCELPRRVVNTVEEAFEALRPEPVKLADSCGLEVTRQGDIFAVPTSLTTREVKSLTPYGKGKIVKRPPGVLGTNHSASEVMFATKDRIYARGTLYHDVGEWRQPDHARRRMGDGKTWHLLMRNTVPRQRRDARTLNRR